MEFVVLGKFRKLPTKDTPKIADAKMAAMAKEGVKMKQIYWTLGRYDTVAIFEAPNERVAMKMGLSIGDIIATETLVAVPRDETILWLK
ncbi:MAG TPA: GYD domain-containing protein [Methanomassiliicoccales archaeon]|nr:GYD domain-containing protein [Methanomassiliicoccales archaeon]